MQFIGKHILSSHQFDHGALNLLFSVADSMKPYAQRQKLTRVLEGAVLSNMFFEPSTRTRVSFGSAFNLLGGAVQETSSISSAITKGESLEDTARIISGYSDVICIRHNKSGSAKEFADCSQVPVINGGDGENEHPTQALLDLYTIKRERENKGQGIDGLRIAMVGDLKNGRTVHSLCNLLSLYKNIQINLVSPPQLQLPQKNLDRLATANHNIKITEGLAKGISHVDILYSTRVQTERFESVKEADIYRGKLRINQQVYDQYCEPGTVIMHPLPRDSNDIANELDTDLDNNPNLAIFRQAQNGLLIRMGLFALVLGVEEQLQQYEGKVNWYSRR